MASIVCALSLDNSLGLNPETVEGYSPLTNRAEKRRSPILGDPLHGAAASRRHAWFARAIIDAKMVLEIAKLPVGAAVIAQR